MSRIGKQPVEIPDKVKVKIEGNRLSVEGPVGKLELNVDPLLEISAAGGRVVLKRRQESAEARARHGLYRNLVRNAVQGVAAGFRKELDIVGVGYRAEVKGSQLTLSLGFSHPMEFPIPEGVKVTVEKQTHLVVSGASRALVGEAASQIRRLRRPEPYKGKGIKYSNEVVRRKVGKQAAGAGGGGK